MEETHRYYSKLRSLLIETSTTFLTDIYLFIFSLINDAVSVTQDYIASNGIALSE
jgi:hypothetical protein